MSVRRGRKAVVVELDEDGREELERMVRRHKSPADLVLRCQIVLAAAAGDVNVDIAEGLGCHPATVSKWRKRFAEKGIQGLSDAQRSGAPRKITEEQVGEVVRRTREEKPEHAECWSTRSMAASMGMTQSAIHRIWKEFHLQPHIADKSSRIADKS